MARLPTTVDVGEPRGARASGATIRPTDFGLDDIAGAVEQAGQAFAVRDDRKAEKLLQEKQAGYETGFAERAAGYDGSEPGFANHEAGQFDAYFKPIAEDPNIPDGVRFALKRRLDDYRGKAGQRAIGTEAQARAEIIRGQREAQSAQNISVGLTEFQAAYSKSFEGLTNEYDGSTRDFADQAGRLATEAETAALEKVPEKDRPAFQARLAGLKPGLQAQAFAYEQNKHQAYVVEAVKTARANTTNSVIGNPEAYGLAFSMSDELLAGLPKALRDPMLREYRGELAAARVQGLILKGDLDTATAELESGEYDKVLSPPQKLQLVEAAQGRNARLAADLIEALRYGGDVDTERLRAAAKGSGDPGLQAKADFAIEVGSLEGEALGSLATGGGTKKGFDEAANFVIDQLEGGEGNIRNDNGRGLSRFGINQSGNPDLNVSTLTRAGAVSRYRRYWQAVGASSLPPGMAIAAFDAAVLFGPDDAKKWLADSGGDVGAFFAAEKAEMQRLAKADPGKYGDDLKGWMNRVEKVRVEAARRQAFANVQDGLSSDPIKFALGGNGRAPLAAVPPLPDQPSGPAFQAALQGRAQVGTMMARQYRAPFRLLTDAEAAQYRDEIQRNPQAGLDLAEAALAAVGPEGARSLMGELGKQGEASVHVHLADLAAGRSSGFARLATSGLTLQAQGGKLEPDDKTGIASALKAHAPALEGMPALSAVVRQTAEAAMLADGSAQSADYYVQGALGAKSVGRQVYGGSARVNGRPTILPPWLNVEYADDALEALAAGWAAQKNGPRYADGTPYPERKISGARLVMAPNGHYRLMDDRGQFMLAPSGPPRPFEFDMDKARESLRGRLGERAVLSR